MELFFQQVFTILNSETGSLAFHLVLTFAIVGALQASFGLKGSVDYPVIRRMNTGLVLLLALRLGMFLASGLAWQGILDAQLVLPLADRIVTLLSLVLLAWLWAFPQGSRAADAANWMVVVLILAMFSVGLGWLSGQETLGMFNGSWADQVAQVFALFWIALGVLLLLIRRPAGWAFGMIMLGLLFAGHLAYLLAPAAPGSYPGAVRLAQMAAYPLLLLLPQRFNLATRVGAESTDAHRRGGEVALLPGLKALLGETDPAKFSQEAAVLVGRWMPADLCVVLHPPDNQGRMAVLGGYDRVQQQPVSASWIENRVAPVLSSSLRRGRSLLLPAGSSSPDLVGVARALGLSQTGDLLAAAGLSEEGPPLLGLMLLSPHTPHPWAAEDQAALEEWAQILAYVLQRNQKLVQFRQELSQSEQSLAQVHEQADQMHGARESLLDQVSALQAALEEERLQRNSLAAVLADQESVQESLDYLQAENERLRQAASLLQQGSPGAIPQLEEELRLTLQEVALLNASLAEADEKILALQNRMKGSSANSERLDTVVNLALELRQPMAAIAGYTDFLLGESPGILNASQRKFLVRIRASTERMERLLDELVLARTSGNQVLAVSLDAVVEEAVLAAGGQVREKGVALQVDLPRGMPGLDLDRTALSQALVSLLKNATTVTPPHGTIWLRSRVESSEGLPDYVLLQVTDQGGGIPSADVPKVFSHLYRTGQSPAVTGVGNNGTDLAEVKALVESVGGRIWVDSDPGSGSTFTLLLPTVEAAPGRRAAELPLGPPEPPDGVDAGEDTGR